MECQEHESLDVNGDGRTSPLKGPSIINSRNTSQYVGSTSMSSSSGVLTSTGIYNKTVKCMKVTLYIHSLKQPLTIQTVHVAIVSLLVGLWPIGGGGGGSQVYK